MDNLPYGLKPNLTRGSTFEEIHPGCWRLTIPAGPHRQYRLAQLDNYSQLKRQDYPYTPPVTVQAVIRASARLLPGTWGIGFLNDPFVMGMLTGEGLHLPALPNTAWFFYASKKSFLTLWDDKAANGLTATSFHSTRSATWAARIGLPVLILLAVPSTARLLRRLMRRFIQQETTPILEDPTTWHSYRLEWRKKTIDFLVDGKYILQSNLSLQGPLGLVIWIDNQYAAFTPQGRVGYGMEENPEPAWIEVDGLQITH